MNYKRISVYSQTDFEVKCYGLGLDSFNVNEQSSDKAFIQILETFDCILH